MVGSSNRFCTGRMEEREREAWVGAGAGSLTASDTYQYAPSNSRHLALTSTHHSHLSSSSSPSSSPNSHFSNLLIHQSMELDSLWNIAANFGETHQQVVPITVFVAVLCFCLIVGHLLEENRWVNESITALIIGCATGTIILLISKGKSSHILRFDEEIFFIYLLPPIIFNAGFQVKKKQFFHNFFPIMLFGVVGVFISSSIVTVGSWLMFPMFGFVGLTPRDFLGIGTIFSSTDTVCTLQVLHQDETPLLYSLVFGEGVVNDATSVVLFNAIQKLDVNTIDGWTAARVFVDFLYLFSTSTALGVASGLVTAYILKGLYFGRHSSIREIALMVLMSYLSYMLAELLELSGILTVFFSGIFMSHYAWHNVTDSSRITTRNIYISIRGNGCSGYREMENEQIKALECNWYILYCHVPDIAWTRCFCFSSLGFIKLYGPNINTVNTNNIQAPGRNLVGRADEGSSLHCFGIQAVHALWCAARSSKCHNGDNNGDSSAL
ncbi:sodium/hydrogen exchanger 4 isoform X2 [Salvia miltiorrhiza]|uniref:sodium/hydrogen exchanger 4 isoform X2 n=1 Tax=Salvia miltiorrhiza TaxID=226208 RepID=UPI0025AD321B|nr:sodium/hydrogen exchanger 4 isoform X2 [Salvia miltiorrhiza]